jgi:hypothetical protein
MRIGSDPIIRIKDTKQQRQIKNKQIQTRVVREVTFITASLNNNSYGGAIYYFLV